MVIESEMRADGSSATMGPGFQIEWWNTATKTGAATVEGVIQAAVARLESFQSGILPSPHNDRAIFHLRQALEALEKRTIDRERRGVEGELVP